MIGRPSQENRELHAAIKLLYRQHDESVKANANQQTQVLQASYSKQFYHTLEPGTFQGKKMRLHPDVKNVSLESHALRGVSNIQMQFHSSRNSKENEEMAKRVFKALRKLGAKDYRFAKGKIGILVTGKNNSDQVIGQFKAGEFGQKIFTLTISSRALEEKIREFLFPLEKTATETQTMPSIKETTQDIDAAALIARAGNLKTLTNLNPQKVDLDKLKLLVEEAREFVPKNKHGEVFRKMVFEAGVLHRHLKPLLTSQEFDKLQPKKKRRQN